MKLAIEILNKFIRKNAATIFVLFLAAFLRLFRIEDYMTFLGDEGRDVLVVYNILHGHLTLLGPTSSVGGFFLGPIYYYFMAPFLWLFNYNPVGPAVMVAIVGIATVWLVYKFASDFFNKKVGFIAAFFYSISPVIIYYSRSSWNPNILPFFSLLTIYIFYKGLENKSLKLLFFAGVLLGICIQLHYLALFLGAVLFFYIIFIEYKKIADLLKSYIFIFLGFLIGWSPFLAFEVRHDFPDFKNIFNFLIYSGNTGVSSNYFSIVYDVFFRVFGRLVFNFPAVEQISQYSKSVIVLWTVFILILSILSVLVLVREFISKKLQKKENLNKYLLILTWFFVGILLFGFYKKSIYDYYFAFMFPLPAILIANLAIFFQKLKFGRVLSWILIVIIAAINFWGIPFRYEPNRQLNQMRSIANFVISKTNGKPFNFALISGGNSDYAYRYFFTLWNHPSTTIEYPGADPKRKTVTNQLFVVCESLPCQPLGNSLWEIAGFGQADISEHWNISVVEIYKLIHHKDK